MKRRSTFLPVKGPDYEFQSDVGLAAMGIGLSVFVIIVFLIGVGVAW